MLTGSKALGSIGNTNQCNTFDIDSAGGERITKVEFKYLAQRVLQVQVESSSGKSIVKGRVPTNRNPSE